VRVVTVRAKDTSSVDRHGAVLIPAYTAGKDSRVGMIRRQCTRAWKVYPLRAWVRSEFPGETVELWLGITVGEAARRMRASGVKYIVNRYPFAEPHPALGRRFNRSNVHAWLLRHLGPEAIAPRSACVFCPFQRTAE